ncbi:MAG: hypothetical protein K2H01_04710, partial [Ruminococcus sp.]|nr:hypothetical protein [Ruminococcus sp.]
SINLQIMSFISIRINDDGQHFEKKIRILGVLVYHRHDYTKYNNDKNQIGFNTGQYCPGDIFDE